MCNTLQTFKHNKQLKKETRKPENKATASYAEPHKQ